MLVIGLTGGIGSGKSTVAALLAERGATVVDVDAVGREVIAPGGRAEAAVIAAFGDGIADDDGHIDRAALAAAVFGRPEVLARLTAISHPAINETLVERIDALPANAVVVLDMAILVESNLGRAMPRHGYTRVVAVEAPEVLRVERAVARGMQEADVRRRIASQATDAERRAVADAVVTNDADLAALTARVGELWDRIQTWR
ncbi:MAG: dephospho-CoA kinase [Ilumatobacteraceae bacterium]|nr:dephospho-CoA kinase [Ilumatobacter sp.]